MSSPPKSILNDIYEFLKWPDRQIERLPLDLESFARLVGVHYLFLLAAVVILSIGNFVFSIDQLDHSIEDLIDNASPVMFIFYLAVLAPILEEIIFRFPLRFRRGSLFIVLMILTLLAYFIAASYMNPNLHLLPEESLASLQESGFVPNISAIFISTLVFTLGLLMIFLMTISHRTLENIGRLIDRLFPYIFYASAMIFGYVHFSNFTGDMKWFWIPLLIIPQFMMGLVMGYARLRFGMLSNIMLHAVNNLIPGLVMLATFSMGE